MFPNSFPLSTVVPVTINFSAPGSVGLPFNQGLVVGNSSIIPSATRVQVYDNLSAVVTAGFGPTAPEYLAMAQYFGQTPSPLQGWIGRQDLTAIAAAVVAVTPAKTITIGVAPGTGYAVGDESSISGVTGSIVRVTAQSGGIPSAVQLVAGGTGATVTNNIATANITGTGSGLEIDVTVVGTGGGTGYVVGDIVGVSLLGASGGYLMVSTTSTGVVTGLATIVGSQGTSFIVASGLTTTGGTGTGLEVNITAIGETPLQAVEACRAATPLWYLGTFVGSHFDGSPVTNADLEAIATYIEGANPSCQWFYRDFESSALNGSTSSLPGVFFTESYRRAHTVFSSVQGPSTSAGITATSVTMTVSSATGIIAGQIIVSLSAGIPVGTTVVTIVGTTVTMSLAATATNAAITVTFGNAPNNIYAAAAPMGRAMGLNTASPGSYFAMAYKQLTGVIAENGPANPGWLPMTQTQAQNLCGNAQRTAKGLNCNICGDYQFGSYISLYQFGTQASGNYFDEILQLDMLANNIQTTVFNYFTTALAVPITDAGVTQIKNLVQQCLVTSQQIGFIAPSGTWQGVTIGTGNYQIGPGSPLPQGYYIYAPSVQTLSAQQLANRQLPPITVLLIESGSGLSQAVIVQVQQ